MYMYDPTFYRWQSNFGFCKIWMVNKLFLENIFYEIWAKINKKNQISNSQQMYNFIGLVKKESQYNKWRFITGDMTQKFSF